MKTETFKVYEYPLKDSRGNTYYGSYTIKNSIKPLGFKDEKLVQRFQAVVKA
jgi:hypothetical protein